MIDLTSRQVQILRAVIEEFISTAEPVASDTIDRKYNLGVSPATIRNEMVYLTKHGYLNQPHTSAGRAPSSLALKMYVRDLMREKDLSVAEEVSLKERIWNKRAQLATLLQESVRLLAQRGHAIGLALTDDQQLYIAGSAYLLSMPEFFDIDAMRSVLTLLDETNVLQDLFRHSLSEQAVNIIFGDELGNANLNNVGLVFTEFNAGGRHCWLGLLGSSRFDYPYIIPMMRYLRGVITEVME
jgi:heat-inducible transcriptional repressor